MASLSQLGALIQRVLTGLKSWKGNKSFHKLHTKLLKTPLKGQTAGQVYWPARWTHTQGERHHHYTRGWNANKHFSSFQQSSEGEHDERRKRQIRSFLQEICSCFFPSECDRRYVAVSITLNYQVQENVQQQSQSSVSSSIVKSYCQGEGKRESKKERGKETDRQTERKKERKEAETQIQVYNTRRVSITSYSVCVRVCVTLSVTSFSW